MRWHRLDAGAGERREGTAARGQARGHGGSGHGRGRRGIADFARVGGSCGGHRHSLSGLKTVLRWVVVGVGGILTGVALTGAVSAVSAVVVVLEACVASTTGAGGAEVVSPVTGSSISDAAWLAARFADLAARCEIAVALVWDIGGECKKIVKRLVKRIRVGSGVENSCSFHTSNYTLSRQRSGTDWLGVPSGVRCVPAGSIEGTTKQPIASRPVSRSQGRD
jgi:hypothetical protein